MTRQKYRLHTFKAVLSLLLGVPYGAVPGGFMRVEEKVLVYR
jgi:hypothetical protein